MVEESIRSSPPALPCPSDMKETPTDAGVPSGSGISVSSNSSWRTYWSQIASLCNDAAADPPSADLLVPPSDLLQHPQQQRGLQEHQHCTAVDGNDSCERAPSAKGNASSSSHDVRANTGRLAAINLAKNSDVLILLDMNGTLLYRAKAPLRASAESEGDEGSVAPAFVHGPVPLHYYMRPGAAELVAFLNRHPRVQLAFYTSMRGTNALPAARFLICGDGGSTDAKVTPEVYDRPFNARDPHGVNHWDTTRDLPLIWSTPNRTGYGFGPANTIMVDDTPRKMRFMDAGLVIVPEFTEACVLKAFGRGGGKGRELKGAVPREEETDEEREERAQHEVLPRLLEYLRLLLDESGVDVRPFIKSNPFRPRACSASSRSAATENGRAKAHIAPSASASTFSFSEAVELLLTTGPLSRENLRDEENAASSAARPEPEVVESAEALGRPAGAVGVVARNGRDNGVDLGSSFDVIAGKVEASMMVAISELLRGATAAAERWELPRQEREKLHSWSRAAGEAATSIA